MNTAGIVLLGLAVGVLVGLMGIGGGIVMVPAMVHLLKMDQHLAQGTSLFLQLPPLGAGALYQYWKQGYRDVWAGIMCALGIFLGGYFGSLFALHTPSDELRGSFGVFLMVVALTVWLRSREPRAAERADG